MRPTTKALYATSLVLAMILPACTWLQPYKVDIQQGAPITSSQIAKLRIGMTQQQVKYIIGSPSIIDPLNPMVWRYSYQFMAGTDAKNANIKSMKSDNLSLKFSPEGTLTGIQGASSFPETYPVLPVSKLSQVN